MSGDEVRCYRCGEVAYVKLVDVSTLADAEPKAITSVARCVTEGCVDEIGRRQPFAPPTAEEIRRHADRVWFDRQMQLTREM